MESSSRNERKRAIIPHSPSDGDLRFRVSCTRPPDKPAPGIRSRYIHIYIYSKSSNFLQRKEEKREEEKKKEKKNRTCVLVDSFSPPDGHGLTLLMNE